MNKKLVVAMVAGGTLAALGIAGTALAAGDDRSGAAPSASASARSELSVSVAAAKDIAVRAAGGGLVESVEREAEHGRAVWDVDVLVDRVEHDIDVDAVTGAVLRHRIEGGATVTPSASTSSGRHAEPGDDRGGLVSETGDDHGGLASEKGDDESGTGDSEAGDDKGGNRGSGSEQGDDHGGRGSEGHGSDD